MRLRYLALSLLLLAAVASSVPARSSPMEDSEAFLEKYRDAFNAHNGKALAGLYTEDAILIPPGSVPIRGREAIRHFWEKNTRRGLSVSALKQDFAGEAGFFLGSYRVTSLARSPMRGNGGGFFLAALRSEQSVGGSLVLCVKRDSTTGSWRIVAETWSETDPSGFIRAWSGPYLPVAP